MLTDEQLEGLATLHLAPQIDGGEKLDLLPLLRAVEVLARSDRDGPDLTMAYPAGAERAKKAEREAYRKRCSNWLFERSEIWGKQTDGSKFSDDWNRAGLAALKSACWALHNEPPDSLR